MRAAAVVAAVCLAAGCGGADEPGGADAAETDLTILVYPRGPDGPSAQYELRCDPDGGTLPDPEASCDDLADVDPAAFEAVGTDVACTEEYGGPDTASVKGTLRGEPVAAQFARSNGCEIARWDALAFLFPEDDGT